MVHVDLRNTIAKGTLARASGCACGLLDRFAGIIKSKDRGALCQAKHVYSDVNLSIAGL